MKSNGAILLPDAAASSQLFCMQFVSEVMPRNISPTDLDFGLSIGTKSVDDRGHRFLSWELKNEHCGGRIGCINDNAPGKYRGRVGVSRKR